MKLKKFFVVLVTLFGTMCRAKMVIETNAPDGFVEFEEAVINILTTCYTNQDTTVALIGGFPGNFVRRVSSLRSFSAALVDFERKTEKTVPYRGQLAHLDWNKRYINSNHKVHIAVIIALDHRRFTYQLKAYEDSPYYNREAPLLAIGWSSVNKYAGCDERSETSLLFRNAVSRNAMHVKLLCRNRSKGIVIYDTNPFENQAPEPWESVNVVSKGRLYYFIREYRKDEGMCKNLDYDKTHDLGGTEVKTMEVCFQPPCSGPPKKHENRLLNIEAKRRFTFIDNFFTYVNATRVYMWKNNVKGAILINDDNSILTQPMHLDRATAICPISYPHGQDCKYLVSQFRGNKSQLEKLISTIDSYSWIGMGMVYVITWMFFKYFLHQPLLVGVLNIVRVTCNCGLTTVPVRQSSRIYLGCLLFFMVTMQGILLGNIASLLTHNIPVRQIDTIQDLADLGYTVYATRWDFQYFTDPIFKGRLIELVENEDCIEYIERDALAACVTWSALRRLQASNSGLHISPDCFMIEYVVSVIPWKWWLETTFDKYLKITLSADIMLDLHTLVDEKRFLEVESISAPAEPKIMTLSDLGFAFVFLGIGLGCSFICFIVEIMIHRLHRRITSTRVIAL